MYCRWSSSLHSFIFNDFMPFLSSVVDPSTKVFALTVVITGHRSHHTLASPSPAMPLPVPPHSAISATRAVSKATVFFKRLGRISRFFPDRRGLGFVTYHFLPLHASVLVPRLHLELGESQRLGQIQPVKSSKSLDVTGVCPSK